MNPATPLAGRPPSECLTMLNRRFPDLLKELDFVRGKLFRQGLLGPMPSYWYLPFDVVARCMDEYMDRRVRAGARPETFEMGTVNLVRAFAAWRTTQGIYRFDATLLDALCATPVTGNLPTEVLRRLPEWAVYIETPELRWGDEALSGLFAQVGPMHSDEDGLTLVLNTERSVYMYLLRLDVPSIEDALDLVTRPDGSLTEVAPVMRDMLPRLVSLVLYLCSEEPDFGATLSPATQARPQPKRIGKGWRMMPARRAMQWEVGTRLGAALRRAWHAAESAQSTQTHGHHAAPRAHIRRAHWHTFLKGPRQQPVRQIRWLPPIPVNVDHPDALVQTVRPVQDNQ